MPAKATAPAPNTGRILVNTVDGRRQPLTGVELTLTISDGRPLPARRVRRLNAAGARIRVTDLEFFDNLFDNYTVVVSADGFEQAGFHPVLITPKKEQTVDVMLVPVDGRLVFAGAQWRSLTKTLPGLAGILRGAEARDRYEQLLETRPLAAAALLNLCTAMSQISLPGGRDPLSYIQELIWGEDTIRQDRFFAWADKRLVDAVAQAAPKQFSVESAALHPGATRSFKQTEFEVANVQLTFRENDTKQVQGEGGQTIDCCKVEPDMDYFRDVLAHGLLEVFPNFFGRRTDPKTVYVLRWIAGQRAGIPFAPPFTIEA